MPKVPPSPLTLKYATWESELENDEDKEFLLDGIKNGFRITESDYVPEQVECDNYKSATGAENRHKAEQQILEEIAEGRYVVVSGKPVIISSLGAVKKPDSEKVRLIHDCSRPVGKSVNSYAKTNTFKYETVDNAVQKLKPGSWMAKVDLSQAYRSVGIHPDCYKATGLKWNFSFSPEGEYTYMIDTRLPFGAAKSCEIFQRISSSVTRMMRRRGFDVISYLDDFLCIEDDKNYCALAYATLRMLLTSLGFTINEDKACPPNQTMIFLGTEISSVKCTLSLPDAKLHKLRLELSQWMGKKKATKKQLQQLIGKLSWAARIIDLMISLKRQHHWTRLSASARADLAWWNSYITVFNGTVCFIESEPVPHSVFSSDACLTGGAAVYTCANDWFYANWHIDYPVVQADHINQLELFTVLLSARRWCHLWSNKHIIVYTDNMTTKYILNSGTSRNKKSMEWLRELFWLSAINNFHLTARHIKGTDNVLSDRLSRLDDAYTMDQTLAMFNHSLSSPTITSHISHKCLVYLQDLRANSGECLYKKSSDLLRPHTLIAPNGPIPP